MNRRDFLQHAGFAAGALALGPPAVRRVRPLGLELYTVRHELSRDPEGTLAAVKAIGYEYVEVVWPMMTQTASQFRTMLDRAGLRAPSGHISTSAFQVGWERRLEAARTLGHEYLFVASLPSDVSRTLDDWREWADRFNAAAAVSRRHGIWLGFHTEPDHFPLIDGKVPYEVFVERLDPSLVRLQLDVGNVAMSGRDPMEYLARWRDRYWSFHLKDVPQMGAVRDTVIGTGKLDFARMLRAAGPLENKLLYVEQEGSANAIDSSRRNYAYLSNLRL